MESQTKDSVIDYIASLGEYAADYAIELNNIHNRLIEKINYLEDDVIRIELQKLENEAHKQLNILQKAIEQVNKDTNAQLFSIEGKILNRAAKQIDELNDMKSQLCSLIEEVERKTSSINKQYHQNLVMKIDVNQKAILTKLEQNYKQVNEGITEINSEIEKLSKKVRFGNVISSIVLGVMVGLVIYLYVVGVIL